LVSVASRRRVSHRQHAHLPRPHALRRPTQDPGLDVLTISALSGGYYEPHSRKTRSRSPRRPRTVGLSRIPEDYLRMQSRRLRTGSADRHAALRSYSSASNHRISAPVVRHPAPAINRLALRPARLERFKSRYLLHHVP